MSSLQHVRWLRRAVLSLFAFVMLAATAGANAADSQNAPFRPETFFLGITRSTGEIHTLGFIRRPFTARLKGHMAGHWLILDERFAFPDGNRRQLWRLKRVGDAYEGTVRTETENGVLAPAVPVKGKVTETGVVLTYEGRSPGGSTRLHFRHEIETTGPGKASNHVVISRFGLPIASANVTFSKPRHGRPRR
ncbi:DUF3833 family protein [Consotaella salsifontis]|uniref:DUF3833 family protein n=1 Tax=Consotaella salsifontis TaxID=1365950 RepID=UPI001055DCCB|nr:DUF3833 family protein [Consotaella salsifontis]